jgi:hypothetical protein
MKRKEMYRTNLLNFSQRLTGTHFHKAKFAKEYSIFWFVYAKIKRIKNLGLFFTVLLLVIHIPSDMRDSGWNITSLGQQRRKESHQANHPSCHSLPV